MSQLFDDTVIIHLLLNTAMRYEITRVETLEKAGYMKTIVIYLSSIYGKLAKSFLYYVVSL